MWKRAVSRAHKASSAHALLRMPPACHQFPQVSPGHCDRPPRPPPCSSTVDVGHCPGSPQSIRWPCTSSMEGSTTGLLKQRGLFRLRSWAWGCRAASRGAQTSVSVSVFRSCPSLSSCLLCVQFILRQAVSQDGSTCWLEAHVVPLRKSCRFACSVQSGGPPPLRQGV